MRGKCVHWQRKLSVRREWGARCVSLMGKVSFEGGFSRVGKRIPGADWRRGCVDIWQLRGLRERNNDWIEYIQIFTARGLTDTDIRSMLCMFNATTLAVTEMYGPRDVADFKRNPHQKIASDPLAEARSR